MLQLLLRIVFLYTTHGTHKYFTYSCLSLLVQCLGLGLDLDFGLGLGFGLGLEPQCLGHGLGTYCRAPITVSNSR